MTAPLLVLRPEPGLSETLARADALDLPALATPLFTAHACEWTPPDRLPDAVLMTSANAARLGGAGLAPLRALPLYAVGAATAAAARAAGFAAVTAGGDGIDWIVARAAADGRRRLLHLCGREHRLPLDPALPIERRVVYAVEAADALPPLPADAVALLHSPRAAALFARLVPDRAPLAVAAISAAALEAAGEGWRATAVAARPDDDALLRAAGTLRVP